MDRNTVNWRGPFTAMVTPFDADGAIDEDAFRRVIEFLIAQGVGGVVANGCTGEFWAQTTEERKRVVALAVEAVAGRIPLIAGTGAIRTADVIELTAHAKEVGCDGAMIIPPYFVKPSVEDVIAHYEAVSDAVKIPVMLYNLPSASYNLTPDLVGRLADVDTVVAIKDSSFDFNNFYLTQLQAGDRIRVLIGPSTMFGVAAMKLGAEGWIDTYSNIWPELTVELFRAIEAGDDATAVPLQATGLEYRLFMTENGRTMYPATKAAMNIRGLPGGYPRLPLKPLGEPHLTELRDGLKRFGASVLEAAAE
ncbi:MAG: 4-hydroxy-tetrahydrodipicolinate synthase [Rhodospirillales bacterium]|jgi:4-hydroxy-tetrahydrodipicolinate synthase|nr:4-hydroxy-tetrahydrodipicolinate synthase [Rhodospirillales bacterium]